jgi:kynurenine formamidase
MTKTMSVLSAGLGIVLFGSTASPAQDWKPLPSSQRCPSKWGAADERGAANHMSPETVMRALRLVKDGKVYELGRVLEPAMPLFGVRKFNLYTLRTGPSSGPNELRGNEETVTTELGQVGTQFDALPHIGIADELYNCNKTDAIATRLGFTKLGVEKVGALITRAVMLDVAAARGAPMLDAGYEITVADLQAALKRQNVSIGKGDAVLIRTGWGQLWLKDNARYNSGQPGLGIAAAEWLVKLDPMLVGSDNWGIEVRPNPNKDLVFPVHQIFIPTHGVFLLENLDLEGMARDQVSEAAFLVQPLKLKGGTGSTVAPIAVR